MHHYIYSHRIRSDIPLRVYSIKNPLVAMLTIGEYDDDAFPKVNVEKDAKNIKTSCYVKYGYTVVYARQEPPAEEFDVKILRGPPRVDYTHEQHYKKRWTEKEINRYLGAVQTIVKENKDDFDALIFFTSSHGDSDAVIYDSTGEACLFAYIPTTFDHRRVPALRNKPKIYVCDFCRGPIGNRKKSMKPGVENSRLKNKDLDHLRILSPTDSIATHGHKPKNEFDGDNHVNIDSILASVNEDDNRTRIVSVKESPYYFTTSHNVSIYANPDGYTTVGGSAGGYLIRSITKLLDAAKPKHRTKHLHTLIKQTGAVMEELQTDSYEITAEQKIRGNVLEYVDCCPFDIILHSKDTFN